MSQFLRNLADLMARGLGKGTAQFLKESEMAILTLVEKAIKSSGRLEGADNAQFAKLYKEYQTTALRDRRALRASGSADEALLNAEIRDDFFNGVLKNIVKSNDERAMIRMALARSTFEGTGEKVTLVNGKGVMTKVEYESFRTVTPEQAKIMGYSDSAMAQWKLVQENEKAFLAAAKKEASKDTSEIGAKETARKKAVEAQQAARDQAAADTRAAQEKADEAAKATKLLAGERGTALQEIDRAMASNDPEKINAAFSSLGKHLNEKEPELVVDSLRQGRNLTPQETLEALRTGNKVTRKELTDAETHFIQMGLSNKFGPTIEDASNKIIRAVENGNKLNEEHYTSLIGLLRISGRLVETVKDAGRTAPIDSYENIARAIANGTKVTKDELNDLIRFVDRKLDSSTISGAMNSSPTPMYGAPAGAWATALRAAESAQKYLASSLPEAGKKPSRNILEEWSSPTREAPNFIPRLANNMRDHAGLRWGVSALALTTGIAINYNFISDLHISGPTAQIRTIIADIAIPDDPETAEADGNTGAKDVVGAIYQRMLKSGAAVSPTGEFESLTTKITGSGFFRAKEKERLEGFASIFRNRSEDAKSQNPIAFDSLEKIEVMRQKLQTVGTATPGVSGEFTDVELTAYKLFLSKIMQTSSKTDDKGVPVAWKPSADMGALFESWSIKVAEQMQANPALRKQVMSAYYGSENPSDDELRNKLHSQRNQIKITQDKSAGTNYFSAMSHYLVLAGVVPTLADARDPEKIAKITSQVGPEQAKARAVEIANKMDKEPAFREKYLKDYLGTPTIPSDILTTLANKLAAGSGKSADVDLAIRQYLDITKAIPFEQSSPEKIIGFLSERQKAEKERLENDRDQRARQGDIDQASRFFGREAPSSQQKSSPEKIQGQFNKLANDDLYPELKGKASTLMKAFDASRTGEEFEEALKKEKIPEETIRPLRKLAYGG